MSDVEIEGRSRDQAILLLAAAEDLGLDASVVRTTTTGYLVPEEVAKQAESGSKEKAPAKKAAAKKTTAKKTVAKKAAKKTASKE
jgi:topoisomerase IA-like protein